MKKDPYEVLGVPRNATQAQLKKAYRAKISAAHPDRNDDAALEAAEINAAYEILGSVEKRKRYDETGGTTEREDPAKTLRRARVMDLMEATLFQAIDREAQGARETTIDIALEMLAKQLKECKDALEQMNKMLAKANKAVARFRRKNPDQDNILGDLLKRKVAELEKEIAEVTELDSVTRECMDLYADHEDTDPPMRETSPTGRAAPWPSPSGGTLFELLLESVSRQDARRRGVEPPPKSAQVPVNEPEPDRPAYDSTYGPAKASRKRR